MATRADVVAAARSLLGTPYQHMGRSPGVALDCAGVLICVARACGLVGPDFDVPAYRRRPDGTLLDWCDAHMRRIPSSEMRAGDAVVIATDSLPQHLALLGDYRGRGHSIIHASEKAKGVIETRLLFSRALRLVAAYALPGIA